MRTLKPTGRGCWTLALGLSIGLHGAGFAALSWYVRDSRGAPPRIALPVGHAEGVPADEPVVLATRDEAPGPVEVAPSTDDPEAQVLPGETGAAAPAALVAQPAEGGEPGVLTAPAPLAANRPPEYPAEARRKLLSGVVVLRVSIEPDGRVSGARVLRSSGHDLLDRAALDAAQDWRFRPASEAGAPVRCEADLPVEFVLRDAIRPPSSATGGRRP